MKLSVLLCCSLLLAVAAGELANWESHGEIIDLERLNKPAIDENLIEITNSKSNCWRKFEQVTLNQYK